MREQNITVNNVQAQVQPVSLFWLAMFVGFIALFWKFFLVAGLLGASAYLAYLAFKQRAEDEQRLREQADQQVAWYNEGDPRGIYGTTFNTADDSLQPTMPAWTVVDRRHGSLS